MEQINFIPPEMMSAISDDHSAKLPSNTLKMLQILATLNTPKELLACLLEIAEFSLHHVRYLAGPLVIHGSSWSDTVPQWLKFACIQDRLELICTEYEQNQVGVSSTPTEVLTYMMPATYDAPLHRDYADLYLWVGNEVLIKHNKLPPGCNSFFELVGDSATHSPGGNRVVQFNQVQNEFNYLSKSIRRSVVKHAAQEGWGKRRVNAKPNLDSTQSTPTPQPSSNSTVQISLF
ncbi:hypothetical protein NIES4074_64260 (plasmid) [Cylindrospermum sp. NIES-4074]|nr:hypothetical protein NIES4074_64260 [Cylindrospermum sp. NIES-4074]